MSSPMKYELEIVKPYISDEISHKYQMIREGENLDDDILVISFSGNYPDGSAGSKHARYMIAKTIYGIANFNPVAVIIDLRELTYRWGNSLLGLFQEISQYKDNDLEEGEPYFPVSVVTSEKCRNAFLSLVTPVGGDEPESHFSDMDDAIEYTKRKAQEWLDY